MGLASSLSNNSLNAMISTIKIKASSIKGKEKLRTTWNQLFKGMVIFLSLLAITPILLIIFDLIQKGIKQINFSFFT